MYAGAQAKSNKKRARALAARAININVYQANHTAYHDLIKTKGGAASESRSSAWLGHCLFPCGGRGGAHRGV